MMPESVKSAKANFYKPDGIRRKRKMKKRFGTVDTIGIVGSVPRMPRVSCKFLERK
jgi:hypothetical protein